MRKLKKIEDKVISKIAEIKGGQFSLSSDLAVDGDTITGGIDRTQDRSTGQVRADQWRDRVPS
ncbi:hypothetical protein GQF61_16155 [Sphingobacterium sp. DK4209]|uniref:Uncharacterized protein n=1 Tax=Sphingobacterium zhuxiongii TaxID=2662364 RepID=A0A5Q0Q8N6_9SPHI|nr:MULTISPECIES: hypothetical protein [unclassified Sphingobacterium]MVZ67388.1 hypothetical protein [Sphingobacterium sp. DK4209]QGA26325.1 hypothetical protein GFH32_08285 [Sphingobacterium sp. dk4302]